MQDESSSSRKRKEQEEELQQQKPHEHQQQGADSMAGGELQMMGCARLRGVHKILKSSACHFLEDAFSQL
jgi:hypothetical protein